MNIKYRVTLSEAERAELLKLIKTGSTKAYLVTEKTVGNVRKRFVEQGFQSALGHKQREMPPSMIMVDGEVEAALIVPATSNTPEGYHRWTLKRIK